MRRESLAHLLVIVVALLAGVLPLRRCLPTDACGGAIVMLGVHSPHDHESSHHQDQTPGSEDGHQPDEASCVDTPIDASLPAVGVGLDAPAVAPAVLPVESGLLEASGAEPAWAPRVDDAVPRGTRTIVLLR